MSHVNTQKSEIKSEAGIIAACERLNMPRPQRGKAKVFSENVEGLVVQLPKWSYPIVINTDTGEISYDNFGGRWGKLEELDTFKQAYSAEVSLQELRNNGYLPVEETLENGTIRLRCMIGE